MRKQLRNFILTTGKKKLDVNKHIKTSECTVVYFTLNENCKNKQQKQNSVQIYLISD